jgi:hypothetical protein
MKLLNNDPLLSQQQQQDDGPMHKNNSIAASSSSSSSSSSLLKPDVLQLSRCPPIHSLLNNKNHDDDDEAPPHKELTSHQQAYSNSLCFGFFFPLSFCLFGFRSKIIRVFQKILFPTKRKEGLLFAPKNSLSLSLSLSLRVSQLASLFCEAVGKQPNAPTRQYPVRRQQTT